MDLDQVKIVLPQSLRIEYIKRNQSFNMSLNHYHNAYEIYYLLSGERYYFIKDKTYHIIKGDLVLINANDLHKTTDAASPVHERILINFSPEFLQNLGADALLPDFIDCFTSYPNVVRLEFPIRKQLEELMLKMVSETIDKAYAYQSCLKALLLELLIRIKRSIHLLPTVTLELKNASYEKIYDILRYINQHYADDLSLQFLSKFFYISPFYLSRIFKRVTGFSYTEYLNSIRTKEAQQLLSSTKFSVTEIAARVGFENITHFGRVFKSITGLSPLRYRKKGT